MCSGPTNGALLNVFSSFLCDRWWCILLLEVFNFHPIGSMARGGTRAIGVYGDGRKRGRGCSSRRTPTAAHPEGGISAMLRRSVGCPISAEVRDGLRGLSC